MSIPPLADSKAWSSIPPNGSRGCRPPPSYERADDNFWAARRVMAFSDDMIRAITLNRPVPRRGGSEGSRRRAHSKTRQDRPGILDGHQPRREPDARQQRHVAFQNAAHLATAPASGYVVRWATFDNTTGATAPIGTPTMTTDRQVKAPQAAVGARRHCEGSGRRRRPGTSVLGNAVDAYFRRSATGWALVGLERMPVQ